ncbi:MAG: type II toxin-antitoxin system Phd/YefM family antitoxin [Candidatus Auribacterota bacterium]|nr:type II toxin-antitoxin system Phd/YefM family antitoxin [Candidatus Auribacterota bacterium]
MRKIWALQDAKNRFSKVVNLAIQDGPQVITRRGDETAVLISMRDYRELAAPDGNLVDFFRSSPLVGLDLQFERDEDYGREVAL